MDDKQTLIDIIFGIVSFLAAYILKDIKGDIKDVKEENSKLSGKVHEMEKLVAGQYVTKTDFKEATATLFERIDAIGDRITGHLERLNERIESKVSREDLPGAVREYNRRYTDHKD